MYADEHATQVLKFQNELISCFQRWLEESDLDNMEMAEASVEVINAICDEEAISFESDMDLDGENKG